ncbi:hypothetical protein ACFWII_30730 [Streptomyces sp. NPDC127063]|uniref:hypothetical protein n=1 Tax=Streptomyces sp. NPDC127063 TaxID=3347123 RepID=UPI003662A8A8
MSRTLSAVFKVRREATRRRREATRRQAKPDKTVAILTAAHDHPSGHSNLAPLGHTPGITAPLGWHHFG